MISIIAAVDKNRNIGLNGDMPWGNTMKADLKRFKKLTDGKTIVMGRKTFESLPGALPNRWHLILTSQQLQLPDNFYGRTIDHIGALVDALMVSEKESFIIGGAEIYKQFMPYADRIYLTKIHAFLEGDTKFPDMKGKWNVLEHSLHPADENNPYPYEYITYERG